MSAEVAMPLPAHGTFGEDAADGSPASVPGDTLSGGADEAVTGNGSNAPDADSDHGSDAGAGDPPTSLAKGNGVDEPMVVVANGTAAALPAIGDRSDAEVPSANGVHFEGTEATTAGEKRSETQTSIRRHARAPLLPETAGRRETIRVCLGMTARGGMRTLSWFL